jgi:hypothetical protein
MRRKYQKKAIKRILRNKIREELLVYLKDCFRNKNKICG